MKRKPKQKNNKKERKEQKGQSLDKPCDQVQQKEISKSTGLISKEMDLGEVRDEIPCVKAECRKKANQDFDTVNFNRKIRQKKKLQVNHIFSKEVPIELNGSAEIKEDMLLTVIQRYIEQDAWIYCVFDFAVTVGYLKAGEFMIHFSDREEPQMLSTASLNELRVFHDNFEFRAIRFGDFFRCKMRLDAEERDREKNKGQLCGVTIQVRQKSGEQQDVAFNVDGMEALSVLDESYKLWGAVRDAADCGEWSLLSSDRGSRIYIPCPIKEHGELSLKVRNYITFPDAEKGMGLIQFVDERFCGFEEWE